MSQRQDLHLQGSPRAHRHPHGQERARRGLTTSTRRLSEEGDNINRDNDNRILNKHRHRRELSQGATVSATPGALTLTMWLRHFTRCVALVATVLASNCAPHLAPSAPPSAGVDVLEFLIGDPALWPRMGDQYQTQVVDLARQEVCWIKYGNPGMYECWRWDPSVVRHAIDHALDGGANRGKSYRFSDGRWLPRRLPPDGWRLDVPQNQVTYVNASCTAQPAIPFPYRLRAWVEPARDLGGDLGVREVLVLEYEPYDPAHVANGAAERFYFARGAGWFQWTRVDGVRVVFNRLGGPRPEAIERTCDGER
jgi:hypothetical protein